MRWCLLLAVVLWASPVAWADDDANAPKPYLIATQDDPQLPSGKIARISGQADGTGPLMELQELTPWQPVMVQIISHDPKAKLHLKISKSDGTDMIFEGDTDQNGVVVAKFKSHHVADILVTSPEGRKGFSLVAWVGPPLPPPMKSVLQAIP